MPDDDVVLPHQNFLDHEAHDALALGDIERLGGAAKPGKESRESLREA
ncbi:MAG TPA: hypothetical protein VKM54_11700 [Myxococcota bacterium]|nr:hypothetical protein [Myxococcota bacterium]